MMFFNKVTSFLLVGALLTGGVAAEKKYSVGARAPNNAMAKNLYEIMRDGDPVPDCGDLGQNEAFQGTALFDEGNGNKAGRGCVRVNICHGNAGFGWNAITVDRDAIGIDNNGNNGHANFEHNDPSNPKREDYFPNTYSLPNPNGAGINNGYIDGNCNFVCPAGDTVCENVKKGQPAPAPTAPAPAPTAPAPTVPAPAPTVPAPAPTTATVPAPTTAASSMMTINVLDHTNRPSYGTTHVLQVQPTDSLGYIKDMVATPAALPADQQIMEFRSVTMPDDEKTLTKYGVLDGNTLVLVDPNTGSHPGGRGDPHFLTFKPKDGESTRYDFHGGCDLVLVDNPEYEQGLGLKIHIRTKVQSWYSYIESVAVQIGTDVLEVQGGHFDDRRYWVNGKRGAIEDAYFNGGMPFTLAGNPVRYRTVKNHVSFQFMIMLSDDEYILIRAVKDFLRVNIENPSRENFGGSVGLMGRYLDGALVSREGIPMDDFNELGQEWQVRTGDVDGPMLFHEVVGPQYPEKCEMPVKAPPSKNAVSPAGFSGGAVTSSVARNLRATRQQAAMACDKVHASPAERSECIEDVLATGDLDMAEEYDAEGL